MVSHDTARRCHGAVVYHRATHDCGVPRRRESTSPAPGFRLGGRNDDGECRAPGSCSVLVKGAFTLLWVPGDAGETPAVPVWVPAPYRGTGQALRGDDGWCADMTVSGAWMGALPRGPRAGSAGVRLGRRRGRWRLCRRRPEGPPRASRRRSVSASDASWRRR